MVPLELLECGACARVVAVEGDARWVRRLAETGLHQGCVLEVLRPGEPMLCRVNDTKLSLCTRGQVEIFVEPQTGTTVPAEAWA